MDWPRDSQTVENWALSKAWYSAEYSAWLRGSSSAVYLGSPRADHWAARSECSRASCLVRPRADCWAGHWECSRAFYLVRPRAGCLALCSASCWAVYSGSRKADHSARSTVLTKAGTWAKYSRMGTQTAEELTVYQFRHSRKLRP